MACRSFCYKTLILAPRRSGSFPEQSNKRNERRVTKRQTNKTVYIYNRKQAGKPRHYWSYEKKSGHWSDRRRKSEARGVVISYVFPCVIVLNVDCAPVRVPVCRTSNAKLAERAEVRKWETGCPATLNDILNSLFSVLNLLLCNTHVNAFKILC